MVKIKHLLADANRNYGDKPVVVLGLLARGETRRPEKDLERAWKLPREARAWFIVHSGQTFDRCEYAGKPQHYTVFYSEDDATVATRQSF